MLDSANLICRLSLTLVHISVFQVAMVASALLAVLTAATLALASTIPGAYIIEIDPDVLIKRSTTSLLVTVCLL